ncbi:MAG TPA: cyanophycin synthetase, partial [Beijerinckiaceae bacterium]|nr:cyanophycin synthetase [Beijerinckiaceae bacterium]
RLRVAFHPPGGTVRQFDVVLPLVGDFQAENALLAAGLVLATEGDGAADRVFAAFSDLQGVPGRLERVGEANGALCVVDYAHKPDAMEHVLDALRPFTAGRLVCVFGCGGDRDRGKRPVMGRIALEKADVVIVTDDNPRSETPATIRAEILADAPGAREIGDRAEAIQAAVGELRPGDVLVVAGKGHETGQIIGDRTLPFSDHEVLRAAITRVVQR